MKRNRTIPLNRSLILILIAISLPTLVYAECTLTLECGGGYGTRTMNFPDRSSCEAKLRETQNWLRSVGGGCDIINACTCEKASEPAYTPPSYDYEAERLREEERQKKAEEERKKQEQEAKEKFERDKKSALDMMKGVGDDTKSLKGTPSDSLGLKGLPSDTPKLKEMPASSQASQASTVRDKNNPCPGGLTALTYFCGGGSEWPYVCCPKGFPYLNHCDCKCYSSSDFDCKSYSYCKEQ
jgi:hypothetical protein